MQPVAEHRPSLAANEATIPQASGEGDWDLAIYYPEVVFVDETSALGRVLRRLSEVLDASDQWTTNVSTVALRDE